VGNPQLSAHRIEGHTEGVANAVGEVFLESRRTAEWIARGSRTVVVEPQNHPGVVRRRAAGIVLQLAVAVQVADDNVKLSVGSEENDTTVVVRTTWRGGQIDNRLLIDKVVPIPSVTNHAVESGRAAVGAAFGKVKIDKVVG